MAEQKTYAPSDNELKTIKLVNDRLKESKDSFIQNVKSKFDTFYKNYRDYNGDRAALLAAQGKTWGSNTFVPLTSSYIRGVDAKVREGMPELRIIGRNQDDMKKSEKIQTLMEYIWDKDNTEKEIMNLVKNCEIFGTGIGKITWHTQKIVSTKTIIDDKDVTEKDIKKIEEVYNDPTFKCVDPYSFFPDPQGTDIASCRYVIQRHLLTKQQILTTFNKSYLKNTEYFVSGSGDLQVLDTVRGIVNTVLNTSSQEKATKDQIEVIEYWEDDRYILVVGGVLAIDIPNPFPHKKKPYVKSVYETLPFEFYGIGIAEQLLHSQKLINTIRNQRIDSVTKSLEEMFVVNDMAIENIDELTRRPNGVIKVLGQDLDNVVRPLSRQPVGGSAYNEDGLIFDAARQATGLDSYSIGQSEAASASASSVVAGKEASALRIRAFLSNIEVDVYEPLFQMWLVLAREFYPNDVVHEIVNEETGLTDNVEAMPNTFRKEENGQFTFEMISKKDLSGNFDFRILSNSGIAASKELDKQNMLNLLDRVATVGSNPATGEQYVDAKKVWEAVILSYGKNVSDFMGANTEQQQQTAQGNQQAFDENKQLEQQQQIQGLQGGQTGGNSIAQQPGANPSGINAPSMPTAKVSPNQL